ncbi:MAG TPA: PspA/IM30 family protein [Candidatus Entotheonella sp.]
MMRITRLFKADMHGLLDLLEEPEAVLKQAIRDMESEIRQGQQILAERRQREERLRRASTQLESSIHAYEEQIDIAFEAQNDDLARTFIRKKLEAENRLQATARAIADMAAETDAMQNRLRDQQAQLDAIIAKMPLVAGEPGDTKPPVGSAAPSGVAEEDVEAAFLREKRKRTAGEN